MDNDCFTDIYEITFDNKNDGNAKYIEFLDYLKHNKNVKFNVATFGTYSESLKEMIERSNEFFGVAPIEKRDLIRQTNDPEEKRLGMQKFENYFNKIVNSDNIVIVDCYIFPKSFTVDYEQLLIKLFNKCNNILIITSKNYNRNLFNNVKKQLNANVKIKIKIDNSIHDRIYLSNHNGGFALGTSLNGIFKKLCLINNLSPEDYIAVNKELKKIGVNINKL